ncbi:inosine 5-monophosphate dehydrogenase [Mycobacterium bohemicum DSM 44277]|uniref:Inosine 5-monophosphate dehydrogenase n=2 Tax=Mycobacterium bohemicum TaxID=56425 RepID=A0A0U0WF01_MYCBE|nr:inosine 5-monophosphate dehydrogenase [Mycobacterium bohemicum DSM 44277]
MGRTARRTYELSEVSIVPSRRTRSSQDVSTAWQLDAYRFEIPVIAHPTDALVSPEFAIELGRLGGLGVLNGEGLIGRHADVQGKVAQLVEAATKEPEPSAAIRLLQELHAAPLNPDLLGSAVARIREAGVTTAVRVSPQNAQALTPVRRGWVAAELAMASGDGRAAVRHATEAVRLARAMVRPSARHRVKSDVVLAAALCSAGDIERARAVAEASLGDAGRLGLLPLRWALACLLIDIGSVTFQPRKLLEIRDICAGEIRHAGATWRSA